MPNQRSARDDAAARCRNAARELEEIVQRLDGAEKSAAPGTIERFVTVRALRRLAAAVYDLDEAADRLYGEED